MKKEPKVKAPNMCEKSESGEHFWAKVCLDCGQSDE